MTKTVEKLTHAMCAAKDPDSWIGLPKTCPACNVVGIIGIQFGLRRMKHNLPQVPQSWCRSCRKQERVIRSKQENLTRDDVIALIRQYRDSTGHIAPEPVKPVKPVKPTTGESVTVVTSQAKMAVIYDVLYPNAEHKGAKRAWKYLFKEIRAKVGANLVISKPVLTLPTYLEIIEEDNAV